MKKKALILGTIIILLLISIFLIVTFINKSNDKNLLIGTWECSYVVGESDNVTETLIFNNNHNLERIINLTDETHHLKLTYVNLGDSIEITQEYEGEIYTQKLNYKIEDSKLIIDKWDLTREDQTVFYKK